MFVSHSREKLVNAIIFFVEHTKHCHTLKLFKLLNFLDFEIYRQTGFPSIGLTYKAWENGPAPAELWHELQKGPHADLAAAVAIFPVRDNHTDKVLRRDIKSKRAFDPKYFSKRELALLKNLAEVFQETSGDDMSDFSHVKGLPWRKVWNGGKGKSREIPYELSLESQAILGNAPTITSDEHAFRRATFAEIEDDSK